MLNASAASLRPGLRADMAVLAQLPHDAFVVRRVGCGHDPRRVACGGPQERGAGDVDHLDGLVETDELDADRRRERLDVDDDEVDRHDALRRQLGHLRRDVAAGEDARVDRVVERPDLATDRRLAGRQVRDRRDLDAVSGEVLAGAVSGEDLDVEREQVAGERGDPVAIGD